MPLSIRRFKKDDAEEASDVIKQGFLSLVPEWYSKENVEDQIAQNSPSKLIEKAKNVNYFIVLGDGKILGIGGYSSEKVHTFFVRPEVHGQGVGKIIMQKVLEEARKEGIRSLKCWSTLAAVKFYSKFGFKKEKKLEVKSENSSIIFLEMELEKL